MNSVIKRKHVTNECIKESLLQELEKDIAIARKQFDVIFPDSDIDFDTALEMYNNSPMADETFYAKPVYSPVAWNQLIDMIKQRLNEGVTMARGKLLKEGTSNFSYETRCVVVTSEDLEDGNYPELGDYIQGSLRSYPSYELEDYNDDFRFVKIVLTNGYYEGACIDCIQTEDTIDDIEGVIEEDVNCDLIVTGDGDNYFSDGEMSLQLSEVAKMWEEALKNEYGVDVPDSILMRDVRETMNKGYIVVAKSEEYIVDILTQAEIHEASKRIDDIKREYGYQEYATVGHFSNGESVYELMESVYGSDCVDSELLGNGKLVIDITLNDVQAMDKDELSRICKICETHLDNKQDPLWKNYFRAYKTICNGMDCCE